MSLTHSITKTWSDSGNSLSKTVTTSSGGEINISESIADGADQLLAFELDVTQLKSLYIVADGALTIEWNDDAGTHGSLVLAADTPIDWNSTDGSANPLTPIAATDISALYITNATGAAPSPQRRSRSTRRS